MTIPTPQPQASEQSITALDSRGRRTGMRIVLALVLIEPLIVMIVLLAVGVPWWLVMCFLAAGVLVLAFVLWVIAAWLWTPWERRFPGQPMLPGAVSQSWQSFTFGRFARLNNCITIVADERHLHLLPFPPLRWVGAGPISLPLDRMTDVRPHALLKTMATATLDGTQISGPRWCIELAGHVDSQTT